MVDGTSKSPLGMPPAAEASHAGGTEFRRLLEKLPAGAYTCDPTGLITYFNSHAVELWGRAPELNHPADRFCGSFKLFSTDGSPIAHEQCWMAQALQMDREYNGRELMIERPSGDRITVLSHASPIHDESGKLTGAVNVLVDISDRKRALESLEEADRRKNEFLATLAHELRNPLAPIRNAVAILQLKTPPVPELQWALNVIGRQMQQMTRLIDDLLDVARITRNRMELRTERIDLSEVLRAAVETSRPLIESCEQTFDLSMPSEPIALYGDLTRLAQVISNLLNNAAKYSERGGRIWLRAERQGSDAVVSVRDTGVGIPAEMLPRIFEQFTQVDRSVDRSQGGLGIGLMLAKRLVEMHGGTIEVHSEGSGKGSEFTIRLPAIRDLPRKRRSAESPSEPVPVATSLRVLIVDDNHDSAASLAMLLRMAGNDVRTANDGAEAVQVAADFRPDVAVLDIGMPHMNGNDAARAIREQPWGRGIVLIAATGWGQERDKHRSLEAGFDHHLVKPVDPVALIQLLATVGRSPCTPADCDSERAPAE